MMERRDRKHPTQALSPPESRHVGGSQEHGTFRRSPRLGWDSVVSEHRHKCTGISEGEAAILQVVLGCSSAEALL